MYSGDETYDNQMKFGKNTFIELEELQNFGYDFQSIHHQIDIIVAVIEKQEHA